MAKLDQNLITEAALTIIESTEQLTLSAIARKLEVTQPALYYHVDGIDDILRWVGLAVRVELAAVLSSATIGLSRADAVRAVASAWRSFSQDHPFLYKSTEWHPVEGDADLEAAVAHILGILADSLRGFDLSDDERANAALALRSTLHGFVSFELGAGNPAPQGADNSFVQVIELLITGIEAVAAGTTAELTSAS